MLKILKRLTAIVLSFMMLLTGGRGYAMYQNQNQNNGNGNGNNTGAPAPEGGDNNEANVPNGDNNANNNNANEGDVLRRNANIARGALERINRIAGNTLQTINSANNPQEGNNGGLLLSDTRLVEGRPHDNGRVVLNPSFLKGLRVFAFSDAETNHIDSFFTKGESDTLLNNIFNENFMKDNFDFEKGIIIMSMQDFFLYPPKNMQDLINKCKLKKDLTNFYALSDLSQIDIEEGMGTDKRGDIRRRNCCQVIKCCALKNSPIIATVIVAPIALIIALAAFLEDGKLTPMEKGGIAILVVLTAISAVVGAFAAKTCCGGCYDCCAPGGKAFLDRTCSEPAQVPDDYFNDFIQREISIQGNNVFRNGAFWDMADTILFFPLKDGKYIIGITKNKGSLGDRNLPSDRPRGGGSSIEEIFNNNKSIFLNALGVRR